MQPRTNRSLCIKCKGKLLCKKPFCPIFSKYNALIKTKKKLRKKEFATSSASIFVGWHGWPKVFAGILSPPELVQDAEYYDAPEQWAKKREQQNRILEMRCELINSRRRMNIKQKTGRVLETIQDIALSKNSVELALELKKIPKPRIVFEPLAIPMGPGARVEKIKLVGNPKIPRQVYKATEDTDLKAEQAINMLEKNGFVHSELQRFLSAGTLGVKFERRLVPTRHSITAVDDIIARKKISEIKDYKNMDKPMVSYGGHMGNRFAIILIPGVWGFELFEFYAPKSVWTKEEKNYAYTTDHELYSGRKSYAQNCGGGYYATRLSVINHLKEIKRQASALIIREVTDEYWVPLGVWVVREGVKKALKRFVRFESLDQALKYTKRIVNINLKIVEKQSKVLDFVKNQKKILQFL